MSIPDLTLADNLAKTGEHAGAMPAIDFNHVGMEFPARGGSEGQQVLALEDVTFSVPAGQFVAIVGESGCGKTTMLGMVAGLVAATQGSVSLSGTSPASHNLDISYMLARDALLPWRSAIKNVELGMEANPDWRSRAKRSDRAREMLEMVGLKDFAGLYRNQLSQGMRQRVAIARSLAPSPKILLMDEPFAALDAQLKLRVQAAFLKIWESRPPEERPTVLLVTHDLEEAVLLADRIIVMKPSPGRIANDRLTDLPRPRADVLEELIFTDHFRSLHHELFLQLREASAARRTTGSPE